MIGDNLVKFRGLIDDAYSHWTAPTNWTFAQLIPHLSRLEKIAVLCGTLDYQVCNSGFMQWHYNRYSEAYEQLDMALAEIIGTREDTVTEKVRNICRSAMYHADIYERRSATHRAALKDNVNHWRHAESSGEDDEYEYDEEEEVSEDFQVATNFLDEAFYKIDEAFCQEVEDFLITQDSN